MECDPNLRTRPGRAPGPISDLSRLLEFAEEGRLLLLDYMIQSISRQTQVKSDASAPSSCMRLMCSKNQDEVEVVKKELLKSGIVSETRPHAMAAAFGVTGVELWVQNERDFIDASEIYAQMQNRAAGRSGKPATNPPGEAPARSLGVAEPGAQQYSPPHGKVNGIGSRHISEPRREELKHASSLIEKGIEEMFLHERELAEQCASLKSKVQELSQALAQGQATLAHEIESRAAAEKILVEQISGLVSGREHERQEWQQKSKGRDDAFKNAQKELDSVSRLLHTQQAAAAALREEILSLELQRDEHEISLTNALAEALAEREARIAAEERAEMVALAQASLEKQLLEHRELEQQMQAHMASLSSLFCRKDTKGAAALAKP